MIPGTRITTIALLLVLFVITACIAFLVLASPLIGPIYDSHLASLFGDRHHNLSVIETFLIFLSATLILNVAAFLTSFWSIKNYIFSKRETETDTKKVVLVSLIFAYSSIYLYCAAMGLIGWMSRGWGHGIQ